MSQGSDRGEKLLGWALKRVSVDPARDINSTAENTQISTDLRSVLSHLKEVRELENEIEFAKLKIRETEIELEKEKLDSETKQKKLETENKALQEKLEAENKAIQEKLETENKGFQEKLEADNKATQEKLQSEIDERIKISETKTNRIRLFYMFIIAVLAIITGTFFELKADVITALGSLKGFLLP